MSRTDPQVNFRLPAELKEQLEESARKNMRSVTAEIVSRLEQSYKPSLSAEDAAKHFEEITTVLRIFEGTINRGFNTLAAVVYDSAKHARPPLTANAPRPPDHPDTPISELMEQARKDGELDE